MQIIKKFDYSLLLDLFIEFIGCLSYHRVTVELLITMIGKILQGFIISCREKYIGNNIAPKILWLNYFYGF